MFVLCFFCDLSPMRGLTIHSIGWPGEGLMTFGVVMDEKLGPLCVEIGLGNRIRRLEF